MKGLEFLRDKTKDGFDELTQLIEPFNYSLNDVIAKFPERIEADINIIFEDFNPSYSSLVSKSKILEKFQRSNNIDMLFYSVHHLDDFYKYEVQPDTTIDLENKVLTGGVAIVRSRGLLTDEEMMNKIIKAVADKIKGAVNKATDTTAQQLHELCDVFDILDKAKDNRSNLGKRDLLVDEIIRQIKEHELRIRDVDFGLRFANWLAEFLKNGNLAAKKNIAMLKVMSHGEKAIYSIHGEEIL